MMKQLIRQWMGQRPEPNLLVAGMVLVLGLLLMMAGW